MKKEKMEYAMNLLTSMVIRQEAFDKNEDCIKIFKEFRRSCTYDCLFDPETGLWMNGPDYILDDYRMEKGRK